MQFIRARPNAIYRISRASMSLRAPLGSVRLTRLIGRHFRLGCSWKSSRCLPMAAHNRLIFRLLQCKHSSPNRGFSRPKATRNNLHLIATIILQSLSGSDANFYVIKPSCLLVQQENLVCLPDLHQCLVYVEKYCDTNVNTTARLQHLANKIDLHFY